MKLTYLLIAQVALAAAQGYYPEKGTSKSLSIRSTTKVSPVSTVKISSTKSTSKKSSSSSKTSTLSTTKKTSTKSSTSKAVPTSSIKVTSSSKTSQGPSTTSIKSSKSTIVNSKSSKSTIVSSKSSKSAGYSYTTPSGCPPIRLATATVSDPGTRTVITSIGSTTSVIPVAGFTTTFYTATDVQTVFEQSTVTTTFTVTSTSIFARVTATVNVPTTPGFTPILCEPEYFSISDTTTVYAATKTSTVAATISYIYSTTEFIPYSVPVYTSTVTSSAGPQTVGYASTSVVTVTRTNPTSTLYDACNALNYATAFPAGSYALIGAYTYAGQATAVPALGYQDCCNLCQADPNCVSDAFAVAAQQCVLFKNDTCAPAVKGPQAYYLARRVEYYISNSKCGQWRVS